MNPSGIALAVLGDPLDYTQSPALHRAGLASVGLHGSSAALRTSTEALGDRLRELSTHGFRGASLTMPLKQAVLPHLDRVSDLARCARSVNTIGFGPRGIWGETTDGSGFVDWMGTLGRDPSRERVGILGGGGASRSVALAFREVGASVVVFVRRPEVAREDWKDIPGARLLPWTSLERGPEGRDLTSLLNGTPLEDPLSVDSLPRRTLIVDLRYGPRVTAWIQTARAAGFEAYDGLGLLVFQARRALALWLARPIPVDPLTRAVGWPR